MMFFSTNFDKNREKSVLLQRIQNRLLSKEVSRSLLISSCFFVKIYRILSIVYDVLIEEVIDNCKT